MTNSSDLRDEVASSVSSRRTQRVFRTFDELKEAVQLAGKSGRPLPLTLIEKGKRSQIKLTPTGPTAKSAPARDRQASMQGLSGEMAPRLMAEMNRGFERMEQQMNEMRARIQRQQRMIEQLRQPNRRKEVEREPRVRKATPERD